MPRKELNMGTTQLYNQIFCNLLPKNNGFNTCKKCALKFSASNPYSFISTEGSEQACLNSCAGDETCTAYEYNTNESDSNCTTYIEFPDEMVDAEDGHTAGYSLSFPYNYQDLNVQQKMNVRTKCGAQYLNNVFVPKKNIDLSECLSFTNSDYLKTDLSVDKKCLFDVFNKNKIKTTIVNTTIQDGPFGTSGEDGSKGDPVIDTYIRTYTNYFNEKEKMRDSNDSRDSPNMSNPINFITEESYQKTLKQKRDELSKISKNIIREVGGPRPDVIESFDTADTAIPSMPIQTHSLLFVLILILFIFLFFILIFIGIKR